VKSMTDAIPAPPAYEEAPRTTSSSSRPTKKPIGVVLVALWSLFRMLGSVVSLFGVLLALLFLRVEPSLRDTRLPTVDFGPLGTLLGGSEGMSLLTFLIIALVRVLVLMIGYALIALGIWLQSEWARIFALVWYVLSVLDTMRRMINGHLDVLDLLIALVSVAVIVYLLLPQTRSLFGPRQQGARLGYTQTHRR